MESHVGREKPREKRREEKRGQWHPHSKSPCIAEREGNLHFGGRKGEDVRSRRDAICAKTLLRMQEEGSPPVEKERGGRKSKGARKKCLIRSMIKRKKDESVG